MRSRTAGKLTEHLWYLGRMEAGVYILEGSNGSVMINGGLSINLPEVLDQMNKFGIDPQKIQKILILHSHFDHVGIVPYFKRKYPHIEVCASEQAWNIFRMPKGIETINAFGQLVAQHMGFGKELEAYDLAWRDDITGRTVFDGDKIDLGGVVLSIIATPGHSSCSITAYEAQMKSLFASDAVGIPFKDTAFPSGNSNFTQYQDSLEKLKDLKVDYLCADHYGYVTGEEAQGFIKLTIAEAQKLRAEMEGYCRQFGGDIDAAGNAVTAAFYEKNPDYFIGADILGGVFKQMVKHIQKTLNQ